MEDVKDDVDEITDSYFPKAAVRVFDKIDNGKDGVILSSNFVGLIETLGEGIHSEELAVHLRKVYPH